MNRRNPQCCCDVTGCCELQVVKPLPVRTVDGGGNVSYSDTAWNASYVTGISGTDNTIPANTTVTISVPIGCTDYVVDVEVLDDAGGNVTNSSPGLTIKVGDCLQVSNELRATTPAELFGASYTSDVIQYPTLFSQHEVETMSRGSISPGSYTQPFYGEYYAAYRFYEVFADQVMESGTYGYQQPPYRSDVSTLFGKVAASDRLPHDAGGLTVQITIETGNDAVEIGLIQVHSGHLSCSSINSLDGVPSGTGCSGDDPVYTVTDPASLVTNNATSTQTSSMSGTVQSSGSCGSSGCTYTYSTSFNFSQWTGNHQWDLFWYDLAGYQPNPSGSSFIDEGSSASAAKETSLLAYLAKCASHSWTHADRLVDWRAFDWIEPELNSATYAISHTLSITGGCNIVAETQANITADLDTIRDDRIYPAGGPWFAGQYAVDSFPCIEPSWCTGDPQQVWKNIQYTAYPPPNYLARNCKPILTETAVSNFWNLSGSFSYPVAKGSATVARAWNFTRSAILSQAAINCSWTYSRNLVDVDVDEDATIKKIPYYSETDLNQVYIGGKSFFQLSTRDNHLKNLQLYIADEASTFSATNGVVMNYTAVNFSTTRPDYATCGCACTASELFQDDMIGIPIFPSGFCGYYHRWMEFTDGTDTWYVKWFNTHPYNLTNWDFLFRRASDCKEIEFTGVSNALPSTSGSVTKTATNSNSDTLSIDVLA